MCICKLCMSARLVRDGAPKNNPLLPFFTRRAFSVRSTSSDCCSASRLNPRSRGARLHPSCTWYVCPYVGRTELPCKSSKKQPQRGVLGEEFRDREIRRKRLKKGFFAQRKDICVGVSLYPCRSVGYFSGQPMHGLQETRQLVYLA